MESVIADKVKRFLTPDDIGYGSGYGDGYGYGSGDGYGSGYGYGDGYGSGYGSGDGYGYGSGSGYGYGDGIKSIHGKILHNIDDTSTSIDVVRGNIAKGHILRGNLTLAPCFIVKGGQYFAHGETLRDAQEALQEKLLEGMSDEERVDAFLAEFAADKAYPAKAFYDWHHRLTGSCEFGRAAFAKDHGIDLEHDMMKVAQFIELTENAYGGNIIRMVKAHMERSGDK
jgi:hypothetical protein